MTDSFVPDKPGWYWHADGIAQVYHDRRSKELRIWRGGQGFDESGPLSDIYDWIAPVPPPDVVDGLVKSLEMLLEDAEQDQHSHSAEPGPSIVAARAALQRYRWKL